MLCRFFYQDVPPKFKIVQLHECVRKGYGNDGEHFDEQIKLACKTHP